MSTNTYKKLSNGWGAWIDTGYGNRSIDDPCIGDVVKIVTKAGEIHDRIVKGIIKTYKSGCVVSLEPNQEIVQKAEKRYAEKITKNEVVKTREQLEHDYDNLQNEGYTDGFNPYRNIPGYGQNSI